MRGTRYKAVDPGPKPLVIGHRGAAGLAPENTMAAFTKALDLGVDGLEMDVILSADREVVVYHDFRLKPEITRRPDGKWLGRSSGLLIRDLPLSAIKTYDVGRLKPRTLYGRRYPHQVPAEGERIPALREVLALLRRRGDSCTGLWIEIKTSPEVPELSFPPETVVEESLRVLEEAGSLSRALILSFDWRALIHAQRMSPEVPTVYLSRTSSLVSRRGEGKPEPPLWGAGTQVEDQGSVLKAIRAAGGRNWGPHYKSITPRVVEEAQRLGIRVFPWTADSRAAMLRLLKMEVDGIITNRPDILLGLL
ncbi:MAG: glycerophosphodiester phosphodiesterase family protein [Thermodesulfobacteriota bacterium]